MTIEPIEQTINPQRRAIFETVRHIARHLVRPSITNPEPPKTQSAHAIQGLYSGVRTVCSYSYTQ